VRKSGFRIQSEKLGEQGPSKKDHALTDKGGGDTKVTWDVSRREEVSQKEKKKKTEEEKENAQTTKAVE